jgi:hypothetical protein
VRRGANHIHQVLGVIVLHQQLDLDSRRPVGGVPRAAVSLHVPSPSVLRTSEIVSPPPGHREAEHQRSLR